MAAARRNLAGRSGHGLAASLGAAALAVCLGVGQARAEIGQGYDTSLPIEITADSLEVRQEQQIAVFRGNVDAVQGDLNLRADQLTVYYRTNEGNENSIRLIEAQGNVFLSSPTEMAQGENGVYNVDADTVELTGTVVLTRGETVIRGDRLQMDLATGRSTMMSGGVETGGEGRVKALFVPNSDNSE